MTSFQYTWSLETMWPALRLMVLLWVGLSLKLKSASLLQPHEHHENCYFQAQQLTWALRGVQWHLNETHLPQQAIGK